MSYTINFVVEDGTGKTDATSYATVAQFIQFWLDQGTDYTASPSSTAIEGYLNAATKYIDTAYKFQGFPVFNTATKLQALMWPRSLVNVMGEAWQWLAFRNIQINEIPREIIDVTCFLANEAKKGSLFPKDESIIDVKFGPVSKRYGRHEGYRRYPYVEQKLRYLIINSTTLSRVN